MLSVKPKSANANQKKQQQGHGQSGWEFVHGKTKDGNERRESERRTRQMWHVFECAGVGLNQRFPRNSQKKRQWRRREKYVKAVSKALKTVQDDCDYGRRQLQQGCPSQQRTHTPKHTYTCKHTNFICAGSALLGLFGALTARQAHCGGFTFRFGFSLRFSSRFQVQCHPMRNAIKTNYQIYV